MGLKILHSADWHLDSPFAGFSEEQRQLLKEKQRQIPGKVADLCRREGCDLVLLAGDIFDGDATGETLELLKEALASCIVPVMIAPGNHDHIAPGSCWLEESWPRNVYIFTGKLRSVTVVGLDCRVYGAAFQGTECEGLLEGFRAEGEEQYRVAVLHGDPTRKDSTYNPVTAAQAADSGLQYLALGHIHKAGAFQSGDTLCAWPGCPMGRGWDETGEKGVCIVTLSNREPEIRAVSLDTLRFYDLEVDVGEDAALALEGVLPPVESEDFYRVTLTGCGNADIPALQRQFERFPNLQLRDKTEPPVDIWANTDTDTLEGLYFSMLRSAMEREPENAERIRLAAEISRKILSGREVKL